MHLAAEGPDQRRLALGVTHGGILVAHAGIAAIAFQVKPDQAVVEGVEQEIYQHSTITSVLSSSKEPKSEGKGEVGRCEGEAVAAAVMKKGYLFAPNCK